VSKDKNNKKGPQNLKESSEWCNQNASKSCLNVGIPTNCSACCNSEICKGCQASGCAQGFQTECPSNGIGAWCCFNGKC